MKVWICGRWKQMGPWEFQGVFSTEEKAAAACPDSTYFIGPATLDKELPKETESWPGCYYPKAPKPAPKRQGGRT